MIYRVFMIQTGAVLGDFEAADQEEACAAAVRPRNLTMGEVAARPAPPPVTEEENAAAAAVATDLADSDALDVIQAMLSGQVWSPDTLDGIADVVRRTGRIVEGAPVGG